MAKTKVKQQGFFRIKDMETGLYYNKKWIMIEKKKGYTKDNFTHWDEYGDVWKLRGSVERMVTQLTRIAKANRDTTAKKVLYGNEKTGKIEIVECEITDKET